ncbi:MAG: Crp/Fnr family transcriptional regulator [Desulfomonilaceae bacterium]
MACLCERLAKDLELHSTCIGHVWVFENLTTEDLTALADAAMRKRYRRGDMIFTQGQRADEMFLIKAGRVKLTKVSEEGGEMTLDIRQGGDFIGENMLNEDMNYPVTAACIEDALTCGFTKESFERLVLERPTIGLQVIKNLSKRIDSLTSRIGNMSLTALEDRLYKVLVNVAREHGIPGPGGLRILFPLTHEDLSFLVGAHRVSITRAIKALKESGKVVQEGRNLIVQVG